MERYDELLPESRLQLSRFCMTTQMSFIFLFLVKFRWKESVVHRSTHNSIGVRGIDSVDVFAGVSVVVFRGFLFFVAAGFITVVVDGSVVVALLTPVVSSLLFQLLRNFGQGGGDGGTEMVPMIL